METTNAQTDGRPSSRDLSEYLKLVAFETVGTDPTKLRAVSQCAIYLKEWLEAIGAEAELVMPAGQITPPIVYAERPGASGAATVLVYGHYDVQPPEPLEAWKTPPFEPTIIGDRVYARGAQDDKGQFFAFLCGVRKFLEAPENADRVPHLKFVLEGQEESGSAALSALLAEEDFRKRLRADVLAVCDTSAAADLQPAITAGLRGVVHFTVHLHGAAQDLHSGMFGGAAPNAAQALCKMLAALHTPDGTIAVPGFLDGIEAPMADEVRAAEA